jgi:predicted RNA-binding protein with PUA domain
VKHKFASVSGIVQDKCMACHSRGYDLPFYAKVPGISAIIEKDYRDGIRAMDLNQELVQRKPNQVLHYELVSESGPDHAKVFTVAVTLNGQVVGLGSGHSKKEAEQSAARAALEQLQK